MPDLRLHGAFRKILNVILCASLLLQSSSVPVSVYSIQAASLPPQNGNEDLAQAQEAAPPVTSPLPEPPVEPASPVNASAATDTDRSLFTDTEIGFQFQPVPPPTLSGLPDPSTTQPVTFSSASNQAPSTTQASIALLPGWNLISIPDIVTDTSPAAVLAPIAGRYSQVFAYDGCDTADPWKLYDPANPGASDLTRIDHRIGFWIQATATVTLPLAGREPPTTTQQLCTGWNLIGMPVKQARPVRSALSSIEGRYARVFGYELADGADPWEVYDATAPDWANDLLQMRPGYGYWVLATENATLAFANEGAPAFVRLISPDQASTNIAAVTFITDVIGTATSDLLQSWALSYRPHGEQTHIPFASGVTPVISATLGRFDPTLLLNGIYSIELTATDYAGQSATTSVDVVVEGQAKVGHFTLSFIDLEVPMARLPIQVIRTYDSRDKRKGDFGVGWTLHISQGSYKNNRIPGQGWQILPSGGPISLPCRVVDDTLSHITEIRLSQTEFYNFRLALFNLAPTLGGCFAQARFDFVDGTVPGATLQILGNTGVFYQNGTNQVIDDTTFEVYNPAQVRLLTVDGRIFDLNRTAGITRIQDQNGNQLVINSGGITHSSGKGIAFTRDGQGRITTITDPAGNPLTYTYDDAGDLVSFTDREDNITTFTYDAAHYLLDIHDPRGIQPIRNEYDESGRLLRHVDAFGNVISYTHSLDARQEIVTDRLGQVRLLEYDARGNMVRETDPLGNVTLRTFDARDNRLSETDPLSNTTTYTYDAQDNLLSLTDPLSNTTRYTYNSRGQALTITDPLGRVITNTYDTNGNLTATTDALGNFTRYTYDARGNLLTQTDPLSNTTRYAYDAFGNPIQQTDPLGVVTTYTYDANGNRLTETITRTTATGTETLTTTYTYDREGRLGQATDPDGTATQTVYDALGKQIATIDKLGRTTSYTYDDLGRLIRTAYPDGTTEETTYDAEGRRLSMTDRGGRTTRYTYDALGRLALTTFPDGAFTTNTYDDGGRLIATTDALSNTTRYGYDAAGRRTVITDSLGLTMTFAYDANGNQVAFTDARSNTFTYEYDTLNRRIRTIFPDDTDQRTAYDPLGRRIAETDQAGLTTQFAYDALGQLIGVTDALSQSTSYAYDELGNLVRQTDANGNTTSFEYDPLGRQTRRTLPVGASETMAYDAAGNLVRRTDFNGATTLYTYDDFNDRLTRRSYPDGSSVAFTYTATGQRATATDARGTTSYTYDSRDRLMSLTYPDGRRLDYGYDAQGHRTSLVAVIGATTLTTTHAYDALNRLATVADPAGRVYTHTYDLNGNRESLSYPNGIVTAYTYDRLNRLTNLVTQRATGQVIQSYAYTLGPAGNRTRIDELDGTARAYTYDELYRLTGETVSGGLSYANTFTYDPVGNRLTQVKTVTSTTPINYAYDARDRLLTENATTYTWDDNGNLRTKSGEATYFWDFENRLIRVEKTDGITVTHTYDADGNRVQTRTTLSDGTTLVTDYLVDTSGPLSQVVAETDGSGNLTAYYVRGDDLLAVVRSGSRTRFYHADGLGSIRRLTDEADNVTDSYTFSAFGELYGRTGTDPQPYQFAGEPFDLNVGFAYHRARWYDGKVARFVRMDPRAGDAFDPQSLHKYVYAQDDPTNRTDPTGTFAIATLSVSFSMISTLASIAPILPAATAAFFSKTRIPTELQPPGTGVGPIILRIFTTGAMANAKRANEVIGAIKRDINRFSMVPGFFGNFSLADTPFKCVAGPNCSEITQDNIYKIDGPFVFNPYVKATTVTNDAFEFTTMKGHPEAGQVKFSANDLPAGTLFTIRVWGHPSTRVDYVLYDLAGHWTQTQIWENFVENVRAFATSK